MSEENNSRIQSRKTNQQRRVAEVTHSLNSNNKPKTTKQISSLNPHQLLNKRRKTVNTKQKALQCINGYLKLSSLHGLNYSGDESLSLGERIFWIISFGGALALSVYFIQSIYYNYNNMPIIIVVNPLPTRIDNVPFPAVTICSMNEVKRTSVKEIFKNGTTTDKTFVKSLCNFKTNINSLPNIEATENVTLFYDFITRVSQPCKEMLKICKWRKEIINCEKLFRTTMTDDGLCCSFNRLPTEYIFRSTNIVKIKENYNNYLYDNWNPETGYSRNIPPEEVFPFKSLGTGVNQGLTIILDVDQNNYYCSSTASMGFKIRFHTPLEVPRIESFSFTLLPEYEYHISFKPIILDSTTSLKNMGIEKRQCYFLDEKYLRYYKTYNRLNCRVECLVNYTFELCGCIPSYLPRRPHETICGEKQEDCSNSIEALIDEQEIKESGDKCHCLPECFQLDYDTAFSFSKIWKDNVHNSTIVRIFPETPFCDRITRTELYGFSEFLSFTGGLLALFLGLSSLSIVEIIYHLTIKLFCQVIRSKRKVNNMEIVIPKTSN